MSKHLTNETSPFLLLWTWDLELTSLTFWNLTQEMVRWAEAPHEGTILQTGDSLSDPTQKRWPKLGANSCHKRSTITGVHHTPGFIPHSPWILGRLTTSSGYRLTEMWWHLSEEAALKLRYTVNVNLCEKNADICRVVALDVAAWAKKSESEHTVHLHDSAQLSITLFPLGFTASAY